ncbi:hypothetical protein LWC33_28880 [Pseudonocardia sp. RS11V-5]|uniref:hypothetical protein n=1 Tax=Pseudonocardia terrae TaxID=2905831 RepID=UPI001E2DF5E6|nr:hypothetical protein [Pseudonocardia terrae]MCE3555448.1 hypothetical protein [Pseudonocardia terrae]
MSGDRPVQGHTGPDQEPVQPRRVWVRVRVPGWPGGEQEIEAESVEALTHYDPSAWRRVS